MPPRPRPTLAPSCGKMGHDKLPNQGVGREANMLKHVGILTSGGDCPGLNAAIRGVGKAAQAEFRMELIGFRSVPMSRPVPGIALPALLLAVLTVSTFLIAAEFDYLGGHGGGDRHGRSWRRRRRNPPPGQRLPARIQQRRAIAARQHDRSAQGSASLHAARNNVGTGRTDEEAGYRAAGCHVVVERISEDKGGAVTAVPTVIDARLPIRDNTLDVTIPWTSDRDAFAMRLRCV